jgi:hypothetical protein
LRCPRCGNENQDTHRFCGMCGAALVRPAASVPAADIPLSKAQESSSATAPRAASSASVARRSEPVAQQEPAISGPSFLGLNQPPPSTSRRAGLSIDPHSSSRNLDYLLEDEEPRSGGGWKVLLIVIALAAAAGFGYLRWKQHGFPWLNTSQSKPPAQIAQNTTANAPAGAPASPETALKPGAITPVPSEAPPAPTTAAPAPASSGPAAATPGETTPAAPPSAPAGGSAAPLPTQAANNNPDTSPTASVAPAEASSSSAKEASPPAPVAARTPKATTAPKSKPSAARPANIDPVAQAQRYLYGKGVSQDCDHGVRLLKPAASQGNPKAMIEMGALYSAGLCTPRDLPTAYRWFALALRKDPSNQSVQTDLQKLWGEMTQPERQLAIRLTQ